MKKGSLLAVLAATMVFSVSAPTFAATHHKTSAKINYSQLKTEAYKDFQTIARMIKNDNNTFQKAVAQSSVKADKAIKNTVTNEKKLETAAIRRLQTETDKVKQIFANGVDRKNAAKANNDLKALMKDANTFHHQIQQWVAKLSAKAKSSQPPAPPAPPSAPGTNSSSTTTSGSTNIAPPPPPTTTG